MKSPEEWFKEAMRRPVNVTEDVLKKRVEVSEEIHALIHDPRVVITEEMKADEMLIMTGRMDRNEFNQYLACKYGDENVL